MTARIQTCFITAPAGSNLDVLTEALRYRDIHVAVPHSLSPGDELGTEFSSILASVDLVIGVLTRERRSEWVLFELGQAWAQGKRILLFAPPNSMHLPSTLRGFLTVRANLSNREAIEFALDQLLAAREPRPTASAYRKGTRPLGSSAKSYLQESFSLGANKNPAELEAVVSNALRESGVEVITTSSAAAGGADLAIWSDGLQSSVGNPLVIEIKGRQLNSKEIGEAGTQLASYVADAGGRWGLLLFAEGLDEPKKMPPNVLALSIEALLRRLGQESFDDIIRDLRNSRVHGRSR